MSKFEDIVYKCPGSHSLPGGSYDYMGVKSEEQKAKALTEGWFDTIGEAIDGKAIELPTEVVEQEDDSPPTREELETQAKELDIKFDGRTKDSKLLSKINEALTD